VINATFNHNLLTLTAHNYIIVFIEEIISAVNIYWIFFYSN